MNHRVTNHKCDKKRSEAGSFQSKLERKFIEQRKIFLWGVVDDKSARDLVEKLLYLDAKEPNKDITFYINSPGGGVSAGMAIYDTMQMISSDVSTVCMGMAASMGAVLLSAGTKGKRFVWSHGRVMIHQPLISGQIIAPALDLKIQAEEIRKIRTELNVILAGACGKNIEQMEKDTDRDFYMTAKEAVDYGIADGVADSF